MEGSTKCLETFSAHENIPEEEKGNLKEADFKIFLI